MDITFEELTESIAEAVDGTLEQVIRLLNAVGETSAAGYVTAMRNLVTARIPAALKETL